MWYQTRGRLQGSKTFVDAEILCTFWCEIHTNGGNSCDSIHDIFSELFAFGSSLSLRLLNKTTLSLGYWLIMRQEWLLVWMQRCVLRLQSASTIIVFSKPFRILLLFISHLSDVLHTHTCLTSLYFKFGHDTKVDMAANTESRSL